MTEPVLDVFDERILILTPTGSDATDARDLLVRTGFCCRVCNDLVELCSEISRGAAAVLVAEEALLRSEIPTLAACLADQPRWSDLQLFLLTGQTLLRAESTHLIESLGRAGTITLLERPFRTNTLLSMLDMALRARRRQYEVRDLLDELERTNGDLERRVTERTAQLSSSIRSLETFGHSLAHDLRAPLRAIRGYMNVLEQDFQGALNGEGTRIVHRVTAAACRMDALVNDLLTLSRIAKEDVPLLPVRAGRIMADALVTMEEEISHTGAVMEVQPMRQMVYANPVLLRQVFENLLSNALKYTAPGTAPRVRISEEAHDSRLRISIKDHGIGIPPEQRQRIFEPFTRLHSQGYAGTGIGLAIVQAAIHQMGGAVGVSSDDTAGVCFWIDLALQN